MITLPVNAETSYRKHLLIAGTLIPAIWLAVYFLRDFERPEPKVEWRTETASSIRSLLLTTKAFTADWDRYPHSLDELLEQNYLDNPALLQWKHPETGRISPWLYNSSASDTTLSRTPLIAQPEHWRGIRIVGYSGGQVIAEPDDGTFTWPPAAPMSPAEDP